MDKMNSILFEVSEEDRKKIDKWGKKHHKTCKHKEIDGSLTYSFSYGSGIGLSTYIKCSCGEEFDYTDYSTW